MTNWISPMELGEMLYHLQFPNRDFKKLEERVQSSYARDADRLLAMLRERL